MEESKFGRTIKGQYFFLLNWLNKRQRKINPSRTKLLNIIAIIVLFFGYPSLMAQAYEISADGNTITFSAADYGLAVDTEVTISGSTCSQTPTSPATTNLICDSASNQNPVTGASCGLSTTSIANDNAYCLIEVNDSYYAFTNNDNPPGPNLPLEFCDPTGGFQQIQGCDGNILPAPVIVVTDEDDDIINGDLPFTAGSCPAGDQGLTFTIENTGSATLTITGITAPAALSLSATTATIAPRAETTITATYDESMAIAAGDQIVISSNAGTVNIDLPTLSATLCEPGIKVIDANDDPITGDLPFTAGSSCPAGDQDLTFTIENTGLVTLSVTGITAPAALSLSATTATIAPGAETTITATYDESMAIAAGDQIVISSNAGTVNIDLPTLAATLCEPDIEVIDENDDPITGVLPFTAGSCPAAEQTLTLTIANTGTAELSITDITAPAALSFSATTATIAAEAETIFIVTYDESIAIAAGGEIVIENNAGDDIVLSLPTLAAVPVSCPIRPAKNIPVFGPLGIFAMLMALGFVGRRRKH